MLAPRLTPDTLMHIFAMCNAKSLMSCGRTCKTFHIAAARKFRLRSLTLFSSFFGGHTQRFSNLLHLHSVVVSSSVALALFMCPVAWKPSDLDIYIGDNAYDHFIVDLEHHFPVKLDADMMLKH